MNTNPSSARPRAIRLFLLALVILALLQFLAWIALEPARPSRAPLRREPDAGARNHSAQQRSLQPSAAESTPSHSTAVKQTAQKVFRYGRGEGELGMVHEQGQPPVGPEAFAVTKDGGILVADVVNQRVVAYSPDGTFLRSISVPGIALGDVAADPQGRVYVYDQVRRALYLYDADGTPRGTLDLNPKDIDTRGYFHVTGNAVYFADAAARDVLVATVQDGSLVAPDNSLERTTDGIHADSGRVYSVAVDKGQALQLQVRDPAQSTLQAVQAPLPGIVSARYAGEDEAGRYYVQTERLDGSGIVLEVLAFSSAGQRLAATQMPENDYFIWTSRLVDVRSDGTIVQFLPEQDQAKLNLFTN